MSAPAESTGPVPVEPRLGEFDIYILPLICVEMSPGFLFLIPFLIRRIPHCWWCCWAISRRRARQETEICRDCKCETWRWQ
jgi:hypothetical protein